MSEVIAFIVEGEKTERQIIDNIKTVFFDKDKSKKIILLPFKTDIYTLYKSFKDDNFLDIIELLIENNPEYKEIVNGLEKGRDSISQIYMLFDYDGHAATRDGNNEIKELLETFNNETENAKLFISYPMVEALKDIKKEDVCSRRCSVIANEKIGYKSLVGRDTDFSDLRKLTKNDWDLFIEHTVKKVNCLINSENISPECNYDKYNIPEYQEFYENSSQMKIFETQFLRYIKVYNKVVVISGVTLFLLDYFGENLFPKIEQ